MPAISDVYEVTFAYSSGSTFTVPTKYAYAVVQAVFTYYLSDQAQPGSNNYSTSRYGTTRFIVKGGRVLSANNFSFDTNSPQSSTVTLTIIGYLPT